MSDLILKKSKKIFYDYQHPHYGISVQNKITITNFIWRKYGNQNKRMELLHRINEKSPC